jgi:nucleotide-binding universal stress UspA family protein
MSYASILVYTDGDQASDHRVRLATELAGQFRASLIGMAACAPRPPVIAADMIASEIEAELNTLSAELAEKERKFFAIAAQPDRKAEWRASYKLPNDAIAEESRAADLVIIGREQKPHDPFRSVDPGAVILRAGRPVMVAPSRVDSSIKKKILIAWQDSREARRVVSDCLPFLDNADEILLTQVCEQDEAKSAKESVHEVAKYLSRHRISADAGIMLKAGGSVADELIRVAETEKVDLIVAGAYGHSRLGEWVFGGVTRELLARSPVCCLFSH